MIKKKRIVIFKLHVVVCVCLYIVCVQESKYLWRPEVLDPVGCKPPNMGSWNQIQDLWIINKCF